MPNIPCRSILCRALGLKIAGSTLEARPTMARSTTPAKSQTLFVSGIHTDAPGVFVFEGLCPCSIEDLYSGLETVSQVTLKTRRGRSRSELHELLPLLDRSSDHTAEFLR